MSFASLGLKLRGTELPSSKPDYVLVCETLMSELECQMKEMEEAQRVREKENKRKTNLADYSWLISTPHKKSYQMTPVERLTLEELAAKVRPEDSGGIITKFRTLIENRHFDVGELPKFMRCIIERYLSETLEMGDNGDSTLRWLARSVTGLGTSVKTLRSQSSSKVYPIAEECESIACQSRRSRSMPEFVVMTELPV